MDWTGSFLLLQYSGGVVWQPRNLKMSQHVVSVDLRFIIGFISDLSVAHNDSWIT